MTYRNIRDVIDEGVTPEVVEIDYLEHQEGDDESDWVLYRVWWRTDERLERGRLILHPSSQLIEKPVCPTCKGSGFLPIPDEPEFDVDTECGPCGGSGYVIPDEWIDAVKSVVSLRLDRDMIRAALVALLNDTR